jgi:hypothetical protein
MTTQNPTLRSIDAAVDALREIFVARFPDRYRALIAAGTPAAPSRSEAKQVATSGLDGLQKLNAAAAFDRRYPGDAAYDIARRDWLGLTPPVTTQATSAPTAPVAKPVALAAATPPSPEPRSAPAFSIRTNRGQVLAAAKAIGTPYLAQLEGAIGRIENGSQPAGRVSEFIIRHDWRVHRFYAVGVKPWILGPAPTTVRTMVVTIEQENESDLPVRIALDQAKKALVERDVKVASDDIRELGSPDGFPG